MKSENQNPDVVPDPRWLLMEHLEVIAGGRTDYREIVAQHSRLRAFFKAEAEAQAKVDAIRQRDAQELAEQLVNPTGLHIAVDHCEQSDAEFELSRAKREADVARACEPAVAERMAEASRQIDILERQTILLVTEILLDDARALAAEINAETKRLRAKYSRLWGLRRYVGDTPAIRKRLNDVPMPTHPDHITPDAGELMTSGAAWRSYAARLAADPDTKFKE